jgi:iron-sulfur cluster repair protein YtfE (RIC family)
MNDVRALIKRDHEAISANLSEVARLAEAETISVVDVRVAFQNLKLALVSHLSAEEEAVYARLKEHAEARSLSASGSAEHERILRRIESLSYDAPVDSKWMEGFRVLREEVESHFEREENGLFPVIEAIFGPNGRSEMAADLDALKLLVVDMLFAAPDGLRQHLRGPRPDAPEIDRHAER